MLDVLEVQDQLKNFSQEQLIKEMQMPSGSIPQFLVLSELNRRRTMSQDLAKRQSADQPTVKEEVVASSGMPMEKASMMAQQMAPNTSMTENTGIASMMPRELPSEEEPIRMSGGGLMNQQAVFQPFIDRMQGMQARLRPSGLQGLGMDIRRQVAGRTDGEVNEFITDVENMAEERFDVNLGQSRTPSPFGGKGGDTRMPRPMVETQPLRPSVNLSRPISNTSGYSTGSRPAIRPGSSAFGSLMRRMNEGGAIKAQSGMFAQMMPKFPTPPAFATIYNYAKTVLGLDDELARDVATKTLEQGEIDKSQLGMFSAKPFGSVEERLSGDDRLAQRKALDTFTGGAEMNKLVDQLSEPEVKDVESVADVPDLDLTQVNPLFSAKPFGTTEERMSGFDDALAQRKALDNFTGGREMSDLVNQLGKSQKVLPENPYADDIKRMTDMGVGSGVASMDKGFKAVGDYLMEDKFADVRKAEDAERTRKALEVFSGGREMDDLVNRMQDEEKMKEAFRFGRGSPFKAEEAEKTKQAFDNFTGGEEMDKLVDKIEKEQKEKKKKKDEEGDSGGLGGFGGASGALSELSAQIAELKEKREKGRESEKWFSLAKLGLGMLASANPTVFGALGEGGLKALEDFKAGKKAYDDDILGYLKTRASIAKSQAELGVKGLVARKQIEALKKKGTGTYGVKEIFDDIAKIDERLQEFADPTKFGVKDEDTIKEINRLRTRRLQLSNLLPAGLRPIEVDLATTASMS